MMKILCLLVKLVFFALACNIQCTITTEGACLNCWSNLCKRPSGSDDDCTGNSCTDMNLGMLISGVTGEQCCEYASSYVSSSVTNGSILMSNPSPSTEQCTAEQYNEFPTDSADDIETISITNSGRQFILYDTVRFNCSGCVKTISIYTGLAVDTTFVSMLQIWSTNTLNNQTLLILKREITFELFNGDSVELSGNNNFKNTREINESLCFNASDVFGIRMPADLGETVRSRKSAGNVKTYARDSPSCESLEKVYLLNSVDIVPNPIITVEVTANPEPSQPSELSTSSSSVQASASLNTLATPLLSSDGPSMSTSMKTIDQPSTESVIDSTSTSSKGGSSSSATSVSIASSNSPIPSTSPTIPLVYIVAPAGIVLFIVVLLVIVGLVIGITLYVRAKRYIKDANGFEMMGHTGRNSVDDMLDFQTRTVSPGGHHLGMINSAGGSTTASQFSTPVHHTYQHPKSSFQQSNYYDDPTALDTSRLDITRSRDYLPDTPDYTTMNSDVGVSRQTPTNITGSRSTVSDNSYRRNLQQLHYDVPKSGRGSGNVNNSHYDEPTALDIPVGTLDPYSQPFSELNDGGGQRVDHNRQYFVLEQDTVQRMTNNPQIPIYHVLERGYHVPSAQERGDMPQFSHETERLNNQPFFEEQPQYWEPAEKTESIYDQLSEKKCRELKRDDIKLVDELGGGQFGTVWSGTWYLRGGGKKNVAVKVCKENAQEQEKARLLREGARMMQFFHTHVVQLYGVVTIDEPLYLVIELMSKGDLKEYLRSCSPIVGSRPILTDKQLLKFCRDVVTGMKHLAKKKFVHRDLAARNIMLNEQLVCKIGDFGMTRAANHNYDLTKPEQIPLRWTAPEALKHRQYSEKSDVYSYGMLMFEIWSLGLNPFPAQENNQLIINFISGGRLMPPPPGCPREMYRLMSHCWHPNPNERPSFENCSDFLSSDDDPLLQWNTEDYSEQPPEVKQLGTGVQHGFLLFMDLQHQYRTEEY